MPLKVFLTHDAVRDLEELYDYISLHGSPGNAERVLKRIEKTFSSLSDSPEHGSYPKKLLVLGIRTYREVYYKPYRLIHKVSGKSVHVLLIFDGRRDMQSLLQRRFLEG